MGGARGGVIIGASLSEPHIDEFAVNFLYIYSGNRTPGSRFYSDLLDTLADFVCIHQLIFKRRSKR